MALKKQWLSWRASKKYLATLERISKKQSTTEIQLPTTFARNTSKVSSKFIGRFDNSMLEEMVEFEKRYSKTWIWAKFKNLDWTLWHIDNISEESVLLQNPEMGDVLLKPNTDVELEVRWPKSKFFNFNNTIFWGFKIPDRQWKRAPCQKNYAAVRTLDSLFGFRNGPTPLSTELLQTAFQPTANLQIIAAINQLKNSSISGVALNDNFAISLPPVRKDFYLLWYKNQPVAEVSPTSKTISVRTTHLHQEVSDFLRDNEQTKWHTL